MNIQPVDRSRTLRMLAITTGILFVSLTVIVCFPSLFLEPMFDHFGVKAVPDSEPDPPPPFVTDVRTGKEHKYPFKDPPEDAAIATPGPLTTIDSNGREYKWHPDEKKELRDGK
jgi:hypothetical protein